MHIFDGLYLPHRDSIHYALTGCGCENLINLIELTDAKVLFWVIYFEYFT